MTDLFSIAMLLGVFWWLAPWPVAALITASMLIIPLLVILTDKGFPHPDDCGGVKPPPRTGTDDEENPHGP